ncbi:unnamed protein product, partial [Mesorhabditis belari]|uniref:Protein kinase domain-containing protein n=1 Tax=Mesorhabditis belari TaxID=2138241 RepID=A0AAF3ELN0_9BILA
MAAKETAKAQPNTDRLPVVGDELQIENRRYRLQAVLGDGGYGTVFLATDGERKLAVKCERYSKSMLHIEVNVLRVANEQKCKHICDLVDYGSVRHEYSFMVMSLLSKDLHRLRSEQPDRRFSFSTAIRASAQALKAIEELHTAGFLSRDIKPGNFAPGVRDDNHQNRVIFLYDFGLARKYVDKNGNLLPSRKDVGWRGTTRYGSLSAHQRQDLARRDDIESWFYMVVEMTKGSLPWRTVVDRTAVQLAKTHARTSGRVQFLYECPRQFDSLLNMVDDLQFESTPKYEAMMDLINQTCDEHEVKAKDRWDWDDENNSTASLSQTLSLSSKEHVKKDASQDKQLA